MDFRSKEKIAESYTGSLEHGNLMKKETGSMPRKSKPNSTVVDGSELS